MPNRIETTPLSEGDQTWLASTRGLDKNQTVKLLLSAFTPTDGYIKSGTPLAIVANEAVPYTAGAANGRENHYGFLRNDVPVVTDSTDTHANVAMVDHGRVRPNRLPVAFTPPAAANAKGLFTYETN